jgi:hypothetical protein
MLVERDALRRLAQQLDQPGLGISIGDRRRSWPSSSSTV